jgi:hypothetical protein
MAKRIAAIPAIGMIQTMVSDTVYLSLLLGVAPACVTATVAAGRALGMSCRGDSLGSRYMFASDTLRGVG